VTKLLLFAAAGAGAVLAAIMARMVWIELVECDRGDYPMID
jgi:hypothetical protein